jgi:3-methyl-2-oxobutanoate hydroxymethyltransferase
MQIKRKTINDIISLKSKGIPIVCLTSYTFPQAKILDEHCDILLVGDSLGMVLYGYESTLAVTVDLMIQHGKAVVKGSQKALVVIDMPFGSYQNNREVAYDNCAKAMAETGAQAVKLEGGTEMAETIKYLVQRGIPVMGHIGMQPQNFNSYGGFAVQGKNDESKNKIIEDAKAIEKAGVFAFVLEAVTETVAEEVSKAVKVSSIGIGASNKCDGQVLVFEDMVGMFDKTPKFVKKFANIKQDIEKAVETYASEVRSRKFPDKNNTY